METVESETVEQGLRRELAEALKVVELLKAEIEQLHKDAVLLRKTRDEALEQISEARAVSRRHNYNY